MFTLKSESSKYFPVQIKGTSNVYFGVEPIACKETAARRAVILALEIDWDFFTATCGDTSLYGVSRQKAIVQVKQLGTLLYRYCNKICMAKFKSVPLYDKHP